MTNRELHKHTTLSRAALETLLSYSWPGNVRELRNDIRRAVLQARTEIWPEHLSLSHVHSGHGPQLSDNGVEFDGSLSLKQIVHEATVDVERKVLLAGAAADAGEQGQGRAAAAGGLQDDSREDQELRHFFSAKRRDSDRAVSETGETSERRRS